MGGHLVYENWVRFAYLGCRVGANWVRFAEIGGGGRLGVQELGSFCIIGFGQVGGMRILKFVARNVMRVLDGHGL